jgi:expansin (peptidoglycan-binding protein)
MMLKCTLLFLFSIAMIEAGPLSVLDRRAGTYTGDGTFYNTGLGSCGVTSNDNQAIAALNYIQMANSANPNKNPNCGKKIKITNVANSKSVTVTVLDTCPTCASGSIDMSPSAFAQIAALSTGRIKISWSWA